jgi:hypothetical protein
MSARPFKPLWVTLPGCEPRRIDSAFDALECLITAWPSASFRSHRRAVRACRDALDGFVPPEKARRMLLEAALDVDLPITSKPFGNRSFAGVRMRTLRRPRPTGSASKPDKGKAVEPQQT